MSNLKLKYEATAVKFNIGKFNIGENEYRYEWDAYQQYSRVFENGKFLNNFSARTIKNLKKDVEFFTNN